MFSQPLVPGLCTGYVLDSLEEMNQAIIEKNKHTYSINTSPHHFSPIPIQFLQILFVARFIPYPILRVTFLILPIISIATNIYRHDPIVKTTFLGRTILPLGDQVGTIVNTILVILYFAQNFFTINVAFLVVGSSLIYGLADRAKLIEYPTVRKVVDLTRFILSVQTLSTSTYDFITVLFTAILVLRVYFLSFVSKEPVFTGIPADTHINLPFIAAELITS